MDPAALGTTVFGRAACGSVPFPDAAASRIGPGSRGRVTRLMTSAVGGSAARGSRCRVGPDHGSRRFRDHRVRSGGVRVGSISGCGRIANWSRVTGSGDAADHQRSGRRGGARIPLPRRARPWIQEAFRDHRVRSGGVRVGSICGCGRIANWSRVTGSGDAADDQRSGRFGGTRIPLPRRARPWIQQV
jgi:hypothetical protein